MLSLCGRNGRNHEFLHCLKGNVWKKSKISKINTLFNKGTSYLYKKKKQQCSCCKWFSCTSFTSGSNLNKKFGFCVEGETREPRERTWGWARACCVQTLTFPSFVKKSRISGERKESFASTCARPNNKLINMWSHLVNWTRGALVGVNCSYLCTNHATLNITVQDVIEVEVDICSFC